MHKPWELPESLRVGQREWLIRSDFRCALDCMIVLEADDLDEAEKADFVCRILFPEWEELYKENLFQDAVIAAFDFLDGGRPKNKGGNGQENKGRVFSWSKDAALIFDAINKGRNTDIRRENVHWWTFLGYYMEISESLFSSVLSLRIKLRDGQKLDKSEKEFVQRNAQYFDIKNDEMHMEEADELLELFGQ